MRSSTNPRALSERALHEYVAEVEGHDSQVAGVVGYFYQMYRNEVLARVGGMSGPQILEVGCGEGMMFDGTGIQPVQMDVSMTRVARAIGKCRYLLCADGYQLPFVSNTFELVLLIAVLEHTREDHLTFTTPAKMRRWLADGFTLREGFNLPFRGLPFAANLYYFAVAQKL